MVTPIAEIIANGKWQQAPTPVHAEQSRRVPQPARLDDLQPTHPALSGAIAAARRWQQRRAETAGASLVLTGPYGTGKTHIARAILWSIRYTSIDDESPVCPAGQFYMATDLMMRLQPTRNEWGGIDIPQASTIVGKLRPVERGGGFTLEEPPMIVIDDVGAEQTLPFVGKDDQEAEKQARYFRVIDYCYGRGISVIMTSNLKPPQLAELLGGRCWDRLSEMAPRGFVIDLSGVPSWRRAQSGR